MELRSLGNSGLVVSRLGLGLAALGRPGYIDLGHADDLERNYSEAAMEARAYQVLDAGWAGGVRYFDAARSYGRAEQFLASWLAARQISPGSVSIGSKWGYTYTAGWMVAAEVHEVKEHSVAVLMRQITESRALLGGYLRLYQIHSVTLESGVLENRDVLEELARLRAAGLKIGITLSGPRQAATLARAMEVVVANERLFDTVQATWNLLERSAGPALKAAHDAGMGVIVKEALANGRLTEKNHDPSFADGRRLLEQVAAQRHTTVDAVALAAVLAQSWVDIVLSGAATVPHLESNVSALSVEWGKQTDRQLAALTEPPEAYWSTRARLPWN
jgi:aryl-alcohol dehydrogenase-like predicted oxidoreductase